MYRSSRLPATGEMVLVYVEDTCERWPVFAEVAADAGVVTYLSAPLFIDFEHAGALNMCGETGTRFGPDDAAWVKLYTTAAEGILHASARLHTMRELAENLRRGLTTRAVIDQAKGVLMATHRI